MRFSKRALLVLWLSTLVACAQLTSSPPSSAPDQAEADTESPELESPVDETPFVAIARPTTATAVSIPPQAREEFANARQAMIREDWEGARAQLLLMSETYPQLAGIYTNLGIVYTQLEQWDDAEKAYRFAIEKNPYNFDAATNLGVLLRERGKFKSAAEVYEQALALWPHNRTILINQGVLYDMYLGNLPAALESFELAQKLDVEEDRQLKGWIIDLQRRMSQQ